MKFRLGYVAMTLNLEDCSPSGTLTYKAFSGIPEGNPRINRLRKITGRNLANTLRILRYNKALNIHVYRLTSRLVPLATHPELTDWDYIADFKNDLEGIGRFIIENNFRISAHPDHFTLLNSPDPKVFDDAFKDLDYHVKLYEAMGLCDYKYKLVLHVGGVYGNKKDSADRFCENYEKLPDRIKKRLVIENDDKSFDTYDVLEICKRTKLPMVLDVHHHNCLLDPGELKQVLPEIFNTWNDEEIYPKVHFSSPKSEKNYRSHADYIDYDSFISFLGIAKHAARDFDIMLEAKAKDTALLKLSEELAGTGGITRLNNGEFSM